MVVRVIQTLLISLTFLAITFIIVCAVWYFPKNAKEMYPVYNISTLSLFPWTYYNTSMLFRTEHMNQSDFQTVTKPSLNFTSHTRETQGNLTAGTFNSYPLINEVKICETGSGKSDVLLLLIIPCATREYLTRTAIRQSYASVTKSNTANVWYVFVFGTNENNTFEQLIREESELFHDLIQVDVFDSYGTLTQKVIAALNWTIEFCSNTQYVIKLDTDTWVNIEKLTTALLTNSVLVPVSAIGGSPQVNAVPDRNPNAKWYVSVDEYPHAFFPTYCSGPAYVMRTATAREIVRVSQTVPFIRIEDVYIGLCARELGYAMVEIPGFRFYRPGDDLCVIKRDLITAHQMSPSELTTLWSLQCPEVSVYVVSVPNQKND